MTESITADYLAGVSVTSLAAKYRVSETTVRRRLRASIAPDELARLRSVFNIVCPEATPELIAADYRDGMTIREIGEKYGIGYTTVGRRLSEAGIKTRKIVAKEESERDHVRFPNGYRWARRGLIQVPVALPPPADQQPQRIAQSQESVA